MLDISLKQMRYAVEIAQCGSINQAAQNLYVTQSSLSKAMKELEMSWATRCSKEPLPEPR